MKIAVLGYSGSGKSTLASLLGEKYNIPVLHLDRIQFVENWHERSREEALETVGLFMENDSWIIDGNYSDFLQTRRLEEADMIILLLFNRFSCFFRGLRRYFKYKGKTRGDMADGCTEKFDAAFMWWILHKGRTKAKRSFYKSTAEKYRLKVKIIKTQKQLDAFSEAQI